MNHKTLGLLSALLLSAGCEWASSTTWDGPSAQCKPVSAACTSNAECCSYGCVAGVCTPGDVVGGVCKTTDDCGYAPGSYTQMLCKSGECSAAATCRDVGDVCSGDLQCCSHQCAAGACGPNQAPVVDVGPAVVNGVPRRQLYTLANATVDPDGDLLTWGWSMLSRPATSAAALSSATARQPTFTPDLEGAYVVHFVATDPWGLSASATLTINVVNTSPTVAPQGDVAAAPRNVPLTITGTVDDPDGDDITCTWELRDPGGTLRLTSGPAGCFGAAGVPDAVTVSLPFPAGLAPEDEGTWTATLIAGDGASSTAGDVLVTVVNTPPVVTLPADRATNLGAGEAPAPAFAVAASFTDQNQDAIATWEWTLTAAPPGSALTTASLDDSTPGTVRFAPDVKGDYVLTVRGFDRPVTHPAWQASFGEDAVTVSVGRHVADLGYEVTDAELARTAGMLVLGARDPVNATLGALHLVDLATGDDAAFPLGSVPVAVSTNAAATQVAAAGASAFWWGTDGGTGLAVDSSVAHGLVNPFSYGDVVVAAPRRVFLFAATTASTPRQAIYAFDPLAPDASPTTGTSDAGTRGTRNPATGDLFVFDPFIGAAPPYGPYVLKYTVTENGQITNALTYVGYSGGVSATRLWASEKGDYVFGNDGTVFTTATPPAPLAQGLGGPLVHASANAAGDVVAVAVADPTRILRYDAFLAPLSPDPLPLWGFDGGRNPSAARYVFVSADGSRRWAIVRATGGGETRWGLVTFP